LGWNLSYGYIVAKPNGLFDNHDDEFFLISPEGSSNKIIDTGGGNYELEKYNYEKIQRFTEVGGYGAIYVTKWVITDAQGTKYTYSHKRNYVYYTTYNISCSDFVHTKPNYRWDLEKIEDVAGNQIAIIYDDVIEQLHGYYYNQIGQRCGELWSDYTKASYIRKITDTIDRTIEFIRAARTDWQDPHSEEGEPDAYQEFYETDRMDYILIKDHNDNLMYKFDFDYDYIGSGSYQKLLLKAITQKDASGNSLPSTVFTYYQE